MLLFGDTLAENFYFDDYIDHGDGFILTAHLRWNAYSAMEEVSGYNHELLALDHALDDLIAFRTKHLSWQDRDGNLLISLELNNHGHLLTKIDLKSHYGAKLSANYVTELASAERLSTWLKNSTKR
jgi:hypothetical protein